MNLSSRLLRSHTLQACMCLDGVFWLIKMDVSKKFEIVGQFKARVYADLVLHDLASHLTNILLTKDIEQLLRLVCICCNCWSLA